MHFLMFIAENFYCDKCAYSFYLLYIFLSLQFILVHKRVQYKDVYSLCYVRFIHCLKENFSFFAKAKVMYVTVVMNTVVNGGVI